MKELASPPPPHLLSLWLSLACRWGRPHFVCCHWSWKSIQTDGRPRQVRPLPRSSGGGLSCAISYCNYRWCRLHCDKRRDQMAILQHAYRVRPCHICKRRSWLETFWIRMSSCIKTLKIQGSACVILIPSPLERSLRWNIPLNFNLSSSTWLSN